MTFDSRGFKGETAHPRVLMWMAFFAIIGSVACVAIGIANTLTLTLSYRTSSNPLTAVSVGIWAPIPMFMTGVVTMAISRIQNASKRWAGMLSFFSAFLFSPALVGVTACEVIQNRMTGVDNSLAIAILSLGCALFVVTFSIMAIIYFTTYAEDQMPLFPPPISSTTPTFQVASSGPILAPPASYQNQAVVGYRVMPVTPSSYTLPAAQTFATNVPSAYYQATGAMVPYAARFSVAS